MPESPTRTVVISGATDGMGRATALERLRRGDTVIAIGSNGAKGRSLVAEAGAGDRLRFIQADLSSLAEIDRTIGEIKQHSGGVDALVLFANRQSPKRRETPDGLEHTFALYYLSRYLLTRELTPLLDASSNPVIISVAGVGNKAGEIHWDDLQLTRRYSTIRAQLQAGRANDLLGVAVAKHCKARFVMYHPGFTRSGDTGMFNPVIRLALTVLGKVAARSVASAVEPIHGFIDNPPEQPLTAIDRGKHVDPSLRTLDPAAADRLATVTEELLKGL
ncbi:NAD(P)-dependent dehydrogenase (short-subunit alcohol dehydrogenase family) [Tamaricihabitans halophyticus]|uniref:NAD(P)-dependent dehydrogenase (Short-subunit alcohol dehydrogenase family) n=1 Tax=Tamaricihabitans halophyticus TaxID=1262583 RepID=A0A4R2R4I0_9PSEU|nr:SDR family NAD(P)-dependent oxidoreductase [Tamaricihabitans halophyticus]TCP57483.1 NAD(P)-dependent dehydrogenase (short-subunit alcohol dehydrogenase family) [Tamaricihabitans halophyticus]